MIPFRDTSDAALGRATFSDFYLLNSSSDSTGIHLYTQQNKILDHFVPFGPRTIMTGFSYQSLSVPLLDHGIASFKSYLKIIGQDYATSIILFEGYPNNKLGEVSSKATAFTNRHFSFRTAMAIRWKSAQHDSFAAEWVRNFVKGAKTVGQNESAQVDEDLQLAEEKVDYSNFSLPETDPKDVYGSNLKRLKEIKSKWDPNGRFRKWFNPLTETESS
jgi:Berberine and berberine like